MNLTQKIFLFLCLSIPIIQVNGSENGNIFPDTIQQNTKTDVEVNYMTKYCHNGIISASYHLEDSIIKVWVVYDSLNTDTSLNCERSLKIPMSLEVKGIMQIQILEGIYCHDTEKRGIYVPCRIPGQENDPIIDSIVVTQKKEN